MTMKKRLLIWGGVLLAAVLAYGLQRGFRYPPLQFDPSPVSTVLKSPDGWRLHGLGAYRRESVPPVVFRAWAPSPKLLFEVTLAGSTELTIENVHPEAELIGEGVEELSRDGLSRRLKVDWGMGENREIELRFPARASRPRRGASRRRACSSGRLISPARDSAASRLGPW